MICLFLKMIHLYLQDDDDLIIFKEELFILKIFYLFQFYRPRNVSLVHVPCSVQRHCE